MRKLLLIALCFGLLPAEAATTRSTPNGALLTQARQNLRLLLRGRGNQLAWPVQAEPRKLLAKPQKPQKPKTPSNVVFYDGIKIFGGTKEFRDKVVFLLGRIKKEAPLHYRVIKKEVVWFKWGKKGSSAQCHQGKIVLGKRDYDYANRRGGKGWFLIAILHEAQHCNIPGDENEDGACWAGYYYGKQMGVRPFLTSYQKAHAVKRGYSAKKWQDNLRRTKAALNK